MKIAPLLLVLTAILSGCASPGAEDASLKLPDGHRVNLVTARDIAIGRGVLGVSDYFTMEGRVVAYASITWTNIDLAWGRNKVEFLWYNGDRLIGRWVAERDFGHPPEQVWSTAFPTALGAGDCRVEVHWRGQKLAQRAFKVVDATAPLLIPPQKKDAI